MTCATCFPAMSRMLGSRLITSSTASPKEIGALVAVLGGIDGLVRGNPFSWSGNSCRGKQAGNLALRGATSVFSNPVRQHSKGFVFAPAVDCEIPVKRQNIRGRKLIRQTNQAGIRKINLPVSVF